MFEQLTKNKLGTDGKLTKLLIKHGTVGTEPLITCQGGIKNETREIF